MSCRLVIFFFLSVLVSNYSISKEAVNKASETPSEVSETSQKTQSENSQSLSKKKNNEDSSVKKRASNSSPKRRVSNPSSQNRVQELGSALENKKTSAQKTQRETASSKSQTVKASSQDGKASFEARKNSSSLKGSKKSRKKARGPSSEEPFSKEDVVGRDYYENVDSKLFREPINRYLNNIENACSSEYDLWGKISIITSNFGQIIELANTYVEKRMSTEDALFLRGIRDFLSDFAYYSSQVTEKTVGDFASDFKTQYSLYYNLSGDASPKDFPDEWARRIFKGLSCLP